MSLFVETTDDQRLYNLSVSVESDKLLTIQDKIFLISTIGMSSENNDLPKKECL